MTNLTHLSSVTGRITLRTARTAALRKIKYLKTMKKKERTKEMGRKNNESRPQIHTAAQEAELAEKDLTDDELEQVAGGTKWQIIEDLQTKIFEITQDVTTSKQSSSFIDPTS